MLNNVQQYTIVLRQHLIKTELIMSTPRSQQISLSDTPYYHCISRCVRRTFLCGIDRSNNKDYSHRKQWIIERLALLSKTFAIDVCAYSAMSNHLHLVLKINESQAQ